MKLCAVVLALFLFALTPATVFADELPLWEAGFGFTGLTLPDYRGSDEQRGYVLPLPYLVYRGEILRADRKGLYGLLFNSERVEINISADASVPVRSSRNSARTGMPNLDPTFQIGPSLDICLISNCKISNIVQIRLPVRAVFTSDFTYLAGTGFVVNPQLNFDFKNLGQGRWNFGFAAGPLFASRKYHEYFYQVDPQYAIPDVRPAYAAPAGYSGSVLILTLTRRYEKVWFGAFVRYDELSDAVFAESPLVKTNHAIMAGFALAWVFGQSQILVEAEP